MKILSLLEHPKIEDLIKIQSTNGNWNYSEYMYGLLNGLIVANSVIDGTEANFPKKPGKWLETLKSENMSLIKELLLLREAEATSEKGEAVKDAKPHLNKISTLLFSKKCEPVIDEKRSKKPIFFGVDNTRSKLVDAKGKSIRLTFDNSTDSGEFEINSLTPLKIVQGSDLDKQIRSLYKRHKVSSKKKMNYLDIDGEMTLREIHLGVSPNEHAAKLVKDLVKLIRGEKRSEEEEEPKKEEPKEEIKEASLGSRVQCPNYAEWKRNLPKGSDFHKDGTLEYAQSISKDFEGVAGTFDHHKNTGWIYSHYLKVIESQDLSEAVICPRVIEVKTQLYLCDLNGKDTEWLPKAAGKVLMIIFKGDILVKLMSSAEMHSKYVRI